MIQKHSLHEELLTIPKYNVQIFLGDLNTQVGREVIFEPTIDNDSLHDTANDNGVKLVSSAT
jgi:hypothetical protein